MLVRLKVLPHLFLSGLAAARHRRELEVAAVWQEWHGSFPQIVLQPRMLATGNMFGEQD